MLSLSNSLFILELSEEESGAVNVCVCFLKSYNKTLTHYCLWSNRLTNLSLAIMQYAAKDRCSPSALVGIVIVEQYPLRECCC